MSDEIRTNFAVLDPLSDQAIAVTRLLADCPGSLRVAAIVTEDYGFSKRIALRLRYRGFTTLSEAIDRDHIIIPTTHVSTQELLTREPTAAARMGLSNSMLEVTDKRWVLKVAEAVGLRAPSRLTVEDIARDQDRTPFFFKELTEQGGGRRGVAYSISDLPDGGEGLLLEEYVNSPGTYGVAFYAQHGEIVQSTCHFEAVSTPPEGGSAIIVEVYRSERLLDLASRLVRELLYTGWGLAEFKWSDRIGDFVLMEINGKLWASSEFSFKCNPRLFEACFGVPLRPNLRPPSSAVFAHRAGSRELRKLLFRRDAKIIIYREALLSRLLNLVMARRK